MEVFQIGVTSFETKKSNREIKSVGGIQMYLLDLVRFLISKDVKGGFIGKIYNFYEIKDFKYIETQKELTTNLRFITSLLLKSFYIKLSKDSIIHAHRPDHLAAFILFKKNISIISLHGQQAKTVNNRKGFVVRTVYNFLENFSFKKASALIAVDMITKKYYSNRYPQFRHKLQIIPTGVDTDIFKVLDSIEIRKKMGFLSSDKIILYVGRIEPPKKIEDIILAFQILVDKDKSYKLIFVGDGVQIDEMKDLVYQKGLNEFVNFLGVRKRYELPEIFNMADCSVLYSKNEGSPLSVKESLACGIPVVANKVGDISTIVKDGINGYIVEEESIQNLAKKIELTVDNSFHMKERCVTSIKPFTIEKVNQQVLDLYNSILDE